MTIEFFIYILKIMPSLITCEINFYFTIIFNKYPAIILKESPTFCIYCFGLIYCWSIYSINKLLIERFQSAVMSINVDRICVTKMTTVRFFCITNGLQIILSIYLNIYLRRTVSIGTYRISMFRYCIQIHVLWSFF